MGITDNLISQSSSMDDMIGWAKTQDWYQTLVDCKRDPKWHGEGDVWAHTMNVCDNMERILSTSSYSSEFKFILRMAALLHDIGKPQTTMEQDGKLLSPRHSKIGARIARRILRDLGISVQQREEIVRLIRFHTAPPNLFRKEDQEKQVIAHSWKTKPVLLLTLTIADGLGRLADDQDDFVERINYWKAMCEEYKCLNEPFLFANDHARFLYFRGQLSSLHYTPHEEFKCNAIMMSGLPGAGKDYWINQMYPGMPQVNLDDIRKEMNVSATDNQGHVIQEAQNQVKILLREQRDFIFNATNLVYTTRQKWLNLFHNYSARTQIVYVEPEYNRLLEQNNYRDNPVPQHMIEKLFNKMDFPELIECHEIVYLP